MNNTNFTNFVGLNIPDEGIISEQLFNTFFKYTALGIFLSMVGLFSSAVIIVTNLQLKQDSYVLFLTGVCVGDNLYLIGLSSGFSLQYFLPLTSKEYQWFVIIMFTFASVAFRRSAVVFNGLASSERFLKLIFPFTSSRLNVLSRYPLGVIVCVFLISLLVHIPLLVEFEVLQVAPDLWVVSPTRLQQANKELFFVLRYVSRITFFYVPITYLLVSSLALVVALTLHVSKQQDIRATRGGGDYCASKSQQGQESGSQIHNVVRTSRYVLVMAVTFLLLALPSTLNACLDGLVPDYGVFGKQRYLFRMITYLAEWVVCLTEPCLLILSMALSKQFRKSVLSMHKRLRWKRKNI